jgi:foldase protein PrsA
MRRVLVIFVWPFLLCSWSACSPGIGSNQTVVIRVGDRSITAEDIKGIVNITSLENGIPKKAVWSSINGLVNRIVDDSLILEYGKDRGIRVEEIELEKAMQEIVRDYPDDSFKETLLTRGIDYNEWKQRLREQLLIKKIVQHKTEGLRPISYNNIRSYYEERKEEFRHPPRVKLLHIVAKTKSDAETLLARIEGGEDMAMLIGEQSTWHGLEMDHGMRWNTVDMLPHPLSEVAFSIPVGEVSAVIKTEYGFHIIKVLKRQLAGRKDILEVMGEIEEKLLGNAIETHYAEWLEQLRSDYPITVNYTLLDKIRGMDEGY